MKAYNSCYFTKVTLAVKYLKHPNIHFEYFDPTRVYFLLLSLSGEMIYPVMRW